MDPRNQELHFLCNWRLFSGHDISVKARWWKLIVIADIRRFGIGMQNNFIGAEAALWRMRFACMMVGTNPRV